MLILVCVFLCLTRPLSFISPGFFGVGVRFCVVYVLISCILFAQNKKTKTKKKPVVCRTWKELRMHSGSPKKLNYQSRRSHSYIGYTWEGQAAKVSYNLYLFMYLYLELYTLYTGMWEYECYI